MFCDMSSKLQYIFIYIINNQMLTNMKQTVNERVKLLRTHLNQTQQEFSSLVGLTNTQLSRIENGEGVPQRGTIQKIIANTGVDKVWLIILRRISITS